MTRYLIDVYRIDIPENGERHDDITEATEDWLTKLGRLRCYEFQIQGDNFKQLAKALMKHADENL